MNISKPSVNKSNTGVTTLISHHKRRTLVTLKILLLLSRKMRESLGRSAFSGSRLGDGGGRLPRC